MWTEVKRCVIFLLLHLGQLTRFLSRSERVIVKLKFFLPAVQVYSYVGIPSPSFAQRVISSRHVGAFGRNYIIDREDLRSRLLLLLFVHHRLKVDQGLLVGPYPRLERTVPFLRMAAAGSDMRGS